MGTVVTGVAEGWMGGVGVGQGRRLAWEQGLARR